MKTSTNAPTKHQRERFNLLHQLGCVVCFVYFKQFRAPDISHILSGGIRIGHDATIPECCWHHRGVPPDGYTQKTALKILGPSRSHGSKPYAEEFGDDTELRDITLQLITKILATKRGHSLAPAPIAEPPAPKIAAGAWTLFDRYAVKTKSVGLARRIAEERPDGKSGTVAGVDWMLAEDFERATA